MCDNFPYRHMSLNTWSLIDSFVLRHCGTFKMLGLDQQFSLFSGTTLSQEWPKTTGKRRY